jgi:hypothetical protein
MNRGKEKKTGQNMINKLFFAMIFACLLTMAGQTACFASTVVLQWDPNTDTDLAGYKVYYQADSSTQPFHGTGATQGPSPIDVHNQTTATISGLDPAHPYYFAVTAYNTSGVESVYSNIVYVPELVSPTVSLSYPTNNATVSGTVSVTASASDNVGVTKVEFYVNGALQATDTSTPYLYSWNTTSLTAGSYTLMAKAYDAAGNVGQSANISVNVVNDSTAPTVSVTAPANGAVVSGTTTITATASDTVGVTKVEFYEDGVLLSATNATPYSYNWNTASVANGSHNLTAKAYDAANNIGQSSTVSVTVNNPDTTAPTVSITAPANSATVSGTVSVTASASDNVGVSKVEFYVNSVLQTTDTSSPYTFSWNTTALANGSYTLSAKAYDAANNIGQSSTVTVTVNNPDTTAPTVSITAPANSATVSGTVSVTASASDNVGVSKVEFYVNNVLQKTDTSSPYTFSWNTTALANGSYTLSAKAYDTANNIGQSSTVTVTVNNPDTTAPTVSITAPANSATVSGTVSVTASASDNVGVSKVEFYVNNVLQTTDTASPFTFSWNTTTLANGSYTLSATAYDAVNNIGQSSTVTVTVNNLDTTVPTVSITAPANNATVNGTVSVTASASDNVGVSKVEFYVNNVLQATTTSAPFTFSWNTTALANGSYTLSAKAYDAANNIGQSSTVTVTVNNPDTTVPTVSITAPANSTTVNGTVSITADASDNIKISKVEFYVKNVLKKTVTSAPYSYKWGTTTVTDGSYTLTAKAYDAAGKMGNSSPVTVLVKNDTKPPTITITSPIADSTVSRIKTVTATASDNKRVTKVEFYVDGELQTTDTASPWRYSWNTASLTNGAHTLSAKAYDASENMGESLPLSVIVFNDKIAPMVSLTSPADSALVSGKVTITGTASDDFKLSKVQFYINNVLKKTYSSESFSYTWATTTVSDGSYTLTAKAIDSFGNVGLSSVTLSVKNDTKAPTVTITSPINNATVGSTKTITATASDNVGVKRVEFYVNGELQATDTAAPWSFSWNTASLTNGAYTLNTKAYDASGNMGQSSTVSVTVFN